MVAVTLTYLYTLSNILEFYASACTDLGTLRIAQCRPLVNALLSPTLQMTSNFSPLIWLVYYLLILSVLELLHEFNGKMHGFSYWSTRPEHLKSAAIKEVDFFFQSTIYIVIIY